MALGSSARRRAATLAACAAAWGGGAARAGAQAVRAVVRDAAGGAPVASALVALRTDGPEARVTASGLTGAAGVRTLGVRPGRYRVEVRRIGQRPFVGPVVAVTGTDTAQVVDKIREELQEVQEAAMSGGVDQVEEEVGDLLFAVTNLARHLGVDPEAALRRTNAKFERRFGSIERALQAQGRTLEEASLDEMEELWVGAKADERKGPPA